MRENRYTIIGFVKNALDEIEFAAARSGGTPRRLGSAAPFR